MLQITIPSQELWDERNEVWVYTREFTLQLEHSLVSISKWEAKWNKIFLSKTTKTNEELLDYIRCMTMTQNVPNEVYGYLTNEQLLVINRYIEAPMTATYFRDTPTSGKNREMVSSELIYYWMIALNIPFDPCQKWHLNRLLTLIRVCNEKNKAAEKKNGNHRATVKQNTALNAQRRRQFHSKG